MQSGSSQNRKGPRSEPQRPKSASQNGQNQFSTNAVNEESNVDAQNLFSLQWTDMDFNLGEVQETNQEANSGVTTADSSPFGCGSNIITNNSLPLLATPESFDMTWPEPSGELRPASHQGVHQLNDTSVLKEMENIHTEKQSHPRSRHQSVSFPTPPPVLSDTCIQELADLSASLMKDLNRVITCKLASSFIFTSNNTAMPSFRTTDGSTTEDNAVGRMLHGSEKFLDILRSPRKQQASPVCSYASSDFSQDEDAHIHNEFANAREGRQNGFGDDVMIARETFPHSNFGRSEWSKPTSMEELLRSDVPSTLAILTCYTTLIKTYETVFYVIHHILECSPSTAPAINLPPTVSGLQINGFLLDNHRNLQIRILIQVSTYMLDQIEKAMGDILAQSMFQAVLKTLLQQEGLDCSNNNKTGMKTARELVQKVDNMLK
ncbi:MAG: hypothetical protein M1820_004114 [Bogoriella megaspora]|nr:MAG: hypothetical protein M1820_004114 [Bogoriella megaspora]